MVILTPEIVRFIRSAHSLRLMSTPCFVNHYAKIFGVSCYTVRDVITYRTWRHVTFPVTDEEVGLAQSVDKLKALDPFNVWLDCDYK